MALSNFLKNIANKLGSKSKPISKIYVLEHPLYILKSLTETDEIKIKGKSLHIGSTFISSFEDPGVPVAQVGEFKSQAEIKVVSDPEDSEYYLIIDPLIIEEYLPIRKITVRYAIPSLEIPESRLSNAECEKLEKQRSEGIIKLLRKIQQENKELDPLENFEF